MQQEISTNKGGRVLEVFGGELWYRVTLELISRFFKNEYKKYIMENLDTEGKSKQLFLEIFDLCLEQTREFFKELKTKLFKENNLEIDTEIEAIIAYIFNDYQKLYH